MTTEQTTIQVVYPMIMTAQCLQEFLTGDSEDLPKVEDFAE